MKSRRVKIDLGGDLAAVDRRVEARDRTHGRAASSASPSHRASRVMPIGVSAPIPVIATRRRSATRHLARRDDAGPDRRYVRPRAPSPARVRDAMPCTNTGPMTPCAAMSPITGHAGPFHTCTMRTSVPASCGSNVHSTSMPVVTPRTCRKRIDGAPCSTPVRAPPSATSTTSASRRRRTAGSPTSRPSRRRRGAARESERTGSAADAPASVRRRPRARRSTRAGARTTMLVDRRHATVGRHRAEVERLASRRARRSERPARREPKAEPAADSRRSAGRRRSRDVAARRP